MDLADSDELAMISSADLYHTPEDRTTNANAKGHLSFEALLRFSKEDPESFWAGVADELQWDRRWDTVMEGGFPHFKFFVGGRTNVCSNLIERHLAAGADNRLALIWVGENGDTSFLTFKMLQAEVNRFANALRKLGVSKGTAVAIFLPNLPETLISVLACYRLGAIFNTVFSGFSSSALRDRLVNYEPQVVITADGGYRRGRALPLKEKVDDAIKASPSVKNVVVVKRVGIPVTMAEGRDFFWSDLVEGCSTDCPSEPVEANEPGMVIYTSGTTGKPKGVVHSGVAFLVNNYVYTKYHMDHHARDVVWCTADIGWLTMHIWGIVGALSNGATTLFYEGALDFPGPERFYEIIDRYRVNKLFTTPTAIRMLMRHGDEPYAKLDLSCLDVVGLVGEPFNPEAWHWLYGTLGKSRIYVNNTWGQTELAGCPLAGGAWISPMKPGSCGVQYFGTELEVVDDGGKPVPPNTKGNLVVTRPFPMMLRTLWREPDRFVKEYFREFPGAYATHDIAIKDADGYFWVLGRADDVIKVAGHRLSTMELESAIMTSDAVAECAVVGVHDAIKGEVPVAFVTLRKGFAPSDEMEGRVVASVEDGIGKIALPSHVFFTDALPKTTSGKIMRRLLKQIATGGVTTGDVTGLEDPTIVERVRETVKERLAR